MLSRSISTLLLAFVALGFGGSAARQNLADSARQDKEARPASGSFDVQKLAEGVYVTLRKEPPGLWFNANNVFIINAADVVVVDSNISAASTKEVLAALRKLTSKPVKYVINTHWHEDHVIGNHVWRDAFPGVEFIGHATTLEDFPKIGAVNRQQAIAGVPGLARQMRSLLEQKKNLAGADLTEEERAGYESDIKLLEQYTVEAPNFQVVLPTLTVEDRLTLHRGGRTIDVRFLGRAHTRADLVVHLPQENIVCTGDLIVWPVPLVGSTSYPLEYGATLEKLLALKAAVIVPGHGPVMRDEAYVRLLARLLNSIKQQVEAAVARGETLEQARKSVNLEEFRKLIAGDSQHKSFIFQNYVTLPAVAAAFRQASEKR